MRVVATPKMSYCRRKMCSKTPRPSCAPIHSPARAAEELEMAAIFSPEKIFDDAYGSSTEKKSFKEEAPWSLKRKRISFGGLLNPFLSDSRIGRERAIIDGIVIDQKENPKHKRIRGAKTKSGRV